MSPQNGLSSRASTGHRPRSEPWQPVNGGNVLVAMLSEPESHAMYLLQQQGDSSGGYWIYQPRYMQGWQTSHQDGRASGTETEDTEEHQS